MPTFLAITGAAGRMGKRLIAIAAEQPDLFTIVAAIDAPTSPAIGHDVGRIAGIPNLGFNITDAIIPANNPQVVIDFSVPIATRALIPYCVEKKIAMIIGTTGLVAADHALINDAAKSIPILQATNTSLGVNLLLGIAAQVAQQLGADYDIEIVEAHHNLKKDAPSGTALSLAESICKATGRSPETDLVHGRVGHDVPRKKGTIGMHAVRMGDVIGEHTIYYATPGERIEIKHTATNRDTFVRGALRAATFLAKQKPGRYTMLDVLDLTKTQIKAP